MRTFSPFTEAQRVVQALRLIPLLELTAYTNRFDDISRVSQVLRFSDLDRVGLLGADWIGAIQGISAAPLGVGRNTTLDFKMNNVFAILEPATRLSDLLNFGLNPGFDGSFWDGRYKFIPQGGGSGDEVTWARLVMEEFTSIGESTLMLRTSGPDLFMNGQDFTAVAPSTIINVSALASGGTTIGTSNTVSCILTPTGGFRMLLVAVECSNFSVLGSPTQVVANGVPLTLLTAVTAPAGGTRMEMYYQMNPAQVPTTVAATWAGEPAPPAGSGDKCIGALCLANVRQASPFRFVITGSGSDTNPRTFPTSARGDLVVDAAGCFFDAGLLPFGLVGAGQTERINRTDAGSPGGTGDRLRIFMSTQPGNEGSVLMDWALDISGAPQVRNWPAISVSLFPAA